MSKNLIHRFSAEKNALLKQQRKISFDDVLFALECGQLLDRIDHYSTKYLHQKIYVVEIDEYVYVVPFVEEKDGVFLKTIYPSRDMTKHYLGKDKKGKKK